MGKIENSTGIIIVISVVIAMLRVLTLTKGESTEYKVGYFIGGIIINFILIYYGRKAYLYLKKKYDKDGHSSKS